ncbi:MAG: NAD-dependent epimerase/dehydratase family protein [Gemmatimonadetes bacterium]|nr:NAD-dependent epimerase/dehydratase family protein [Gemmatimonadota bacterium]
MSGITLVTGATGFIGRYVLRRLAREPETCVRVLVRRPDALDAKECRGIEVIRGDVRDPAALSQAMHGVDTVLHLAACARAWARDPSEFSEINVEAVRRLLGLAAEYGVPNLVHVSTVLTLPPVRAAQVNGRSQVPTPYESSKREGERLVESYAAAGRHAVIVHPTRVYGPGPLHDANGVTRAIALYLSGRLRVRLADGDVLANYVHAEDVAAGIVLAARRGHSGTHYVLGGEDASFRQLLEFASDVARLHRRVVALPVGVALAFAGAAEWWGHLGGRAFITRGWVRGFLEDRRADSMPARQDLGYAPRGLNDGLSQTVAWLRAAGKVPR